ncbi:MAG: Hsp70 family protein [Faecousia sp.]
MENNQLLRVAIDFGSTTSVMGWQCYEQTDQSLRAVSTITWRTYPTQIIEQSDNPGLSEDVFAQVAQQLQQKSLEKTLRVKTGFKQALLFPAGDEYSTGYRLTKKFFGFLYREFEKDSALAVEDKPRMELLLTVPLGTHPKSVQDLKKIAAESGFSPDHGFETVTVINEARCLTDYAFTEYAQMLTPALRRLAEDPSAASLALFVDIGGLTGDFTLAKIHYDEEQKEFVLDELPMDRAISDGSDLGGIALDKALMRYLEEEKLIDPEAARNYTNSRGYQIFREFKEQANTWYWCAENAPENLCGIPHVLSRWSSSDQPEAQLQEYSGQLTPEVMEERVAAEYIERIIRRVNDYLADVQISPEDIDWIFLTGGGSQMFFMPRVLQGKWAPKDSEPLRLDKIRDNPARLIRWEEPTTSCLRGALAEPEQMEFLRASNSGYCVRIAVKIQKGLLTDQTMDFMVPLASKNQTFPIHAEGSRTFTYEMSALTRISVTANLIATGTQTQNILDRLPMDTRGEIDAAGARMTMRKNNAGRVMDVVTAGGSMLAAGACFLVSSQFPEFNGKAAAFYNAAKSSLNLSGKYSDTLTISYDFTIDENGQLTGSIRGSSPVLQQNDGQMELVIS